MKSRGLVREKGSSRGLAAEKSAMGSEAACCSKKGLLLSANNCCRRETSRLLVAERPHSAGQGEDVHGEKILNEGTLSRWTSSKRSHFGAVAVSGGERQQREKRSASGVYSGSARSAQLGSARARCEPTERRGRRGGKLLHTSPSLHLFIENIIQKKRKKRA